MSNDKPGRRVPTGRIARVGRLGALAGRIATNVVTRGAGQWATGKRPTLSGLLMTPANITRIADQLATMRGAAMKIGQLISMDGGDFLPPELAEILARLRDNAEPMPKAQLIEVLANQWQPDWQDTLLYFSFTPVAAASIGQVHKVITLDGDILAIKVQYPGVKASIDADVDNVATLIRLSGLIPKDVALQTILDDAKAQLHQEADYQREAKMLSRYRQLCTPYTRFEIPQVVESLTTDTVLAMTYHDGIPIEELTTASQGIRDAVMAALMTLFFREVFDFQLLQSDPNLANYRYRLADDKLILLDFGATREIPDAISRGYQQLLQAAADEDTKRMAVTALALGLILPSHSALQRDAVVAIGMQACESIRHQGAYDFGNSDLLVQLHDMGMALTYEHNFWHVPPADALFIHRKLGGLYMLAKRLGARMDMRAIAAPWLD
ncbi:AarF/ABC1/UbiB kinase family protein [Alteromonas sp. ASW11-19]|uniref:AarF/ABC1/UbiB kinase family protein n=1 Tax=Alteromonas salexigens TaxID=2982530 RepID=A0ABT2VJZ3_9ALTE|nr:AarF/ABC1/UbiB kinase family protein [Alteromonas salexigens]MCU7553576.1 AarF/ABC1/UbiB kinase family protein [Alteromonas salexigens]